MKKVLLVVIALVMVLSGVAAVSAYEAHTVNVKAHIENAISCHAPVLGLQFGTRFPEEWVTKDFDFGVSPSFCAPSQLRVTFIDYEIYVVHKPIPGTSSPVEYYPWLGDALYIGVNADDKWPDDATHPGPGDLALVGGDGSAPILVATGTLEKAYPGNVGDPTHWVTVGLDTPVFEGYWNSITDALACPDGKPSGRDLPTLVLTGARNVPAGIDLGADIVIQITGFH